MSQDKSPHDSEERQAGISEEEQREIREHIDKVAAENRIEVTPQLFRFSAGKSGAVVPIAVNMLAALLIVLGFLGLSRYFEGEEQAVITRAGQSSLVESRLIQELRRESRSQMFEMEREIEGVRAQLATVERERAELMVDIERRVAAREDEVRERLLEELARERSRLDELGLAETDIEQRMMAFEAERTLFYEQQLRAYRESLEAERVALEQDLDRLRDEFSGQLARLDSDRARLASEFAGREEDLRARLAERSAALEEQRARAEAGSEEARQRLEEITRSREQVALIRSQINGLYRSIRNRYEEGEYDAARTAIADLRSFLATEAVESIPELAERREVDLFLLETIDRTVQRAQSEQARVGVVDRLAALEQIRGELESVQALLDEAQTERNIAQQRAGTALDIARTAVAEARYAEALNAYRDIFTTLPDSDGALSEELVALLRQGGFGAPQSGSVAPLPTSTISPAPTPAEPRVQTVIVQDDAEIQRLNRIINEQIVVVNRYIALGEAYQRYARSEDQILSESGEFGRLRSKALFDQFLGSPELRELFPDLSERVRGYDAAFESAGREDAIQDMIDIVATLTQLPSTDRIAFLESEIRAGNEASLVQDFLFELRDLIGS
ncbi:MAG: hypothetical protein EA428_06510 [Spirochaetaceae bacterium]|nr:MAG: hypothetical protein EA428_06510 [Spirochaetaceae bacterium]